MPSETIKKANAFIAATYKRLPDLRGEGCNLWTNPAGPTSILWPHCDLGHAHPGRHSCRGRAGGPVGARFKPFLHPAPGRCGRPVCGKQFRRPVFSATAGLKPTKLGHSAVNISTKKQDPTRFPDHCHGQVVSRAHHGNLWKPVRKGFDPVLGGFDFVPFERHDGSQSQARSQDEPCCSNRSGRAACAARTPVISKPSARFATKPARLIFDEIQTGMGRTEAVRLSNTSASSRIS